MKRRVVVTGMGVVSPIGQSVQTMWTSIQEGYCGIGPITHFDGSEFKVHLAAQVNDLETEAYFSKRELKFNDRFTIFARIAAKQAIQDGRIDIDALNANRFGVMVGSGIGGVGSMEEASITLMEKGPQRVSPFFIPKTLVNLAAGSVAIDVKAKGHCSAPVSACAAGSNAIGDAFHKIKDGYQDVMICGGSEASITPLSIAGFRSMRALHEGSDPTRASIPFDAQRSGFVMGEGAGILVLEELSHALERKATVLAEMVGYGTTCDAHHITAPLPSGEGGANAMLEALADANIPKEAIDYINAHGTSTPLNDKSETLAVKQVFQEHAYKLAISSTKSNTGHLLGASGALEAIVCVKALQDGYIPPTIHYQVEDSECDLDVVANHGRHQAINYAMSNSLGFGGHNASLIFKKWEDK